MGSPSRSAHGVFYPVEKDRISSDLAHLAFVLVVFRFSRRVWCLFRFRGQWLVFQVLTWGGVWSPGHTRGLWLGCRGTTAEQVAARDGPPYARSVWSGLLAVLPGAGLRCSGSAVPIFLVYLGIQAVPGMGDVVTCDRRATKT